MVAPLDMHASRFLTMASQAPKVFTLHGVPGGGGVRELAYPRPHDLHGATVPHNFLNPDPPYWVPAEGAALFWVWCTQELGPNDCRNLDRDAQREVKTHFNITQVGCFY
jgi:hypothetical protein